MTCSCAPRRPGGCPVADARRRMLAVAPETDWRWFANLVGAVAQPPLPGLPAKLVISALLSGSCSVEGIATSLAETELLLCDIADMVPIPLFGELARELCQIMRQLIGVVVTTQGASMSQPKATNTVGVVIGTDSTSADVGRIAEKLLKAAELTREARGAGFDLRAPLLAQVSSILADIQAKRAYLGRPVTGNKATAARALLSKFNAAWRPTELYLDDVLNSQMPAPWSLAVAGAVLNDPTSTTRPPIDAGGREPAVDVIGGGGGGGGKSSGVAQLGALAGAALLAKVVFG